MNKQNLKIRRKAQMSSFMMFWLFFFIMILITVGIVLGISSFFGDEYDTREIDAEILNEKVSHCIENNDFDLSSVEIFDKQIEENCGLAKKIIEEKFFVYIDYGLEEKYSLGKTDSTQCALSELNKNYPKCVDSTITKNGVEIFIQTGSNQKAEVKVT